MRVVPLEPSLEPVSDVEAAGSRLLFSWPLTKVLASWLPGLTIQRSDVTAQSIQAEGSDHFRITLRGSTTELSLQMPWDIDPVSASILSAGSWSSAVQLACLRARANSLFSGFIDWLGRLDLYPVQLDCHARELPPPAGAIAFECRLGDHRLGASLTCHDLGWLARAAQQIARLDRPSLAGASHLALPVCVVLGLRQVSLGLLASLQVGDVLMLPGTIGADGVIDNGMLVIGHRGRGALGWPCKVHGRLITAKGDKWMSTETLGANAARQDEAESAADGVENASARNSIADLEVDLHIDLQVLSMSVGELASMQPGYVLELPVPATDACVDLVVGGQIFGRAQLVRVGDRLGARILEVFRADV